MPIAAAPAEKMLYAPFMVLFLPKPSPETLGRFFACYWSGYLLVNPLLRRGVRAGRRSTTGNRVYVEAYQEFKSLPLRHKFKGLRVDHASPFFICPQEDSQGFGITHRQLDISEE